MLEFARILGEYLTHEEPKTRKAGNLNVGLANCAAMGCLSGVIASLPPKTMNMQEVDVLTTFYCDRMEDEIATTEIIDGISILQRMSGFGDEEVAKVCDAYLPTMLLLIQIV